MTDPSPPAADPPTPPGHPDPSAAARPRSPWDPPVGTPSPALPPPLPDALPPPLPPLGVPPAGAPPAPTPVTDDGPPPPPWGVAEPAPWTPSPPGSAGVPTFGGSAGAGSSGAPEPLRGVRGQRYGGPRYNAKVIFSVLGLLGLLITIGIMGVLSGTVMGDLGGGGDRSGNDALRELTTPTTAPTGTGPVTTAAPGVTAQVGPSGPTGAATAASCASDRDTVHTAAEAYKVMNGSYPPDLATLIASGLLQADAPVHVELHVEGDVLSVVGTGPCTGG